MIRVIVDSQSNRLFRGVRLEQSYDQRGGLCEVGSEGIVVTTDPIDPQYLQYWRETLGFDLPRFLAVGPFNPEHTLSELLLAKPDRQATLRKMLQGETARLEFFCIEEPERKLPPVLGIPAYCNFDVAIPFSRKIAFKKLADEIGIPTPSWLTCATKEEFLAEGRSFLKDKGPFLLKASDGTGGFACGGMSLVQTPEELERGFRRLNSQDGDPTQELLIEKVIPGVRTVSAHWEILDGGKLKFVDLFEQRGEYAYSGVSWPADISIALRERLMADIERRFGPQLIQMGAIGFFCADIVIDREERHWWVDFNPRKGAILYVYNMVRRLRERHLRSKQCWLLHEHFRLTNEDIRSFSAIEERLGDLLLPQEEFVVVTNPGVFTFGYADIAGISTRSPEQAKTVFHEARERLLS
ncbi:MAG: hypothetical protein HYV55_02470 [Parcubacteria group bacterium]|nr:hypothetical protein [Parcubacteria group bacterium]